jgi:hypothetical protein
MHFKHTSVLLAVYLQTAERKQTYIDQHERYGTKRGVEDGSKEE